MSVPTSEVAMKRRPLTAVDLLRALVLVFSMGTLALWGFFVWDFPLNLVFGLGAPLLIVVIWALFLSPRSMLATHPYLRALIELLIYVGITVCWWSMGQAVIGLIFGAVAVMSGLLAGRRAL